MTKYFLVLLLTAVSVTSAAAKECCLCDECGPVDPEKVDLFTVSPFRDDQPEGATCEDIALELLDHDEDSEMCANVRMDLHEACCTSHFDEDAIDDDEEEEGQLAPYVRGARQLWRATARGRPTTNFNRGRTTNRNRNFRNTNRNANRNRNPNRNRTTGGYQRPGPNGTKYNTRYGNFSCTICAGRNVLRFQAMVMRDPQRGVTVRENCPALIANFKNGKYSNYLCNIANIKAKQMCCPASVSRNDPRVSGNLGSTWRGVRGRGGW